jgi:hypothetical protein
MDTVASTMAILPTHEALRVLRAAAGGTSHFYVSRNLRGIPRLHSENSESERKTNIWRIAVIASRPGVALISLDRRGSPLLDSTCAGIQCEARRGLRIEVRPQTLMRKPRNRGAK